jgi:hypothetical protein
MPVFVEWRWQEKTKSFLVIFHFYDDFSKPNLRIRRYEKDNRVIFDLSRGEDIWTLEAWMSWAPSHVETAMLSELLSYANIINGLGEPSKRQLINPLTGKGGKGMNIVQKVGLDKRIVWLTEDSGLSYAGFEICPIYVDYLREILKPYLK